MCPDLGVDVAEAGDHVVRRVELVLLGRGREHDGVGVVPGADGEVPGEVGGGLRGASAVAGAVAPAGDDALPDVGDHPHLRDLRQVLPGEAPLGAELPVAVGHRGVGARLRVAAHPSRRSHACVHTQQYSTHQFCMWKPLVPTTGPGTYGSRMSA
jgi:hypothetical protein